MSFDCALEYVFKDYIFESDRTFRPRYREPELVWFSRLESYFPDFVKEFHLTQSCIHPVEGDPDMVGSQVIVDNGGCVKHIFTINKRGQSASISTIER